MTKDNEQTSDGADPDDGIGCDDGDIRDLFSFNLQRLASLSTKIATQSVYEPYGLSIPEWRVLAVLGYLGEVSVLTVAKHAAILRTQLPKVTSELEKRGLIFRKSNPDDGRSALLALTDVGQRLVTEILSQSRERNADILARLSPGERQDLMRLMRTVIETSRDHLTKISNSES